MDYYLERRAAFWEQLRYNIDSMRREIETRKAEKWPNQIDLTFMNDIQACVNEALRLCLISYHDVLTEQINALNNKN